MKYKKVTVTLEIWNSANFKTLINQKSKILNTRTHPDYYLAQFKEGKHSGIHSGSDKTGTYYGYPDTGYSRLAYRIKVDGQYL